MLPVVIICLSIRLSVFVYIHIMYKVDVFVQMNAGTFIYRDMHIVQRLES